MEILLSHNNLDFDGLAALLGAKKLFPNAHIVLAGKVSKNIQDFFALHKDALPYRFAHQLDTAQITSAVLVDTASAKRLGPLKDFMQNNPHIVRGVYDHHPVTEGDFPVGEGRIEYTGAATTLLVEEIKKCNIELNAFEATLLALGIYEDTGGLTFTTTTARDVYAAGYLIEKGAKLSLIANFTDRPITPEQRNLLNFLLNGHTIYNIHGYKVLVATAVLEDYVAGLNTVTHQMAELSNADILFSVVTMDDRVHMVARSRVDALDVGLIASEFAGGGHGKAASATIKTTNINAVVDKLHKLLIDNIIPAVTAETIMSSPVKTLAPNISIQEAGKIMLRYGHTGLPIVDEGKLVGIISRRDLDKARHHGLGHAPVKAFMSRDVCVVSPKTPLSEIRVLMMNEDIGRLPVIKDDNLVGIVSRTDILKTIHGDSLPASFSVNFVQACPLNTLDNLSELMVEHLPHKIYQMIVSIGQLADEHDFNVFLVGGFVRDLLLGLPNYDLDVVVEGDGISFAKLLAEKMSAKLRAHEKFATAVIFLPDGDKIDIATARTEFYEFPAALPTVESSSLKQDLYRRDFTINAMAVSINAFNFGEFIDYFNGKSDLDKKLIRVLYNLSFVEDPTRIIRAVRFEQRYGFKLEKETMGFAQHAIENNLIEELSYHRIREELDLILHELNPLPAVKRMHEIGLWQHILPEIVLDKQTLSLLRKTHAFLFEAPIKQNLSKSILYLCSLFAYVGDEQVLAILERFQWTKKEREGVQEFLKLRQKITETDTNSNIITELPLLFTEHTLEALVAVGNLFPPKIAKKIHQYIEKRLNTSIEITGRDLAGIGLKPGPLYRQLLNEVLSAKIAGKLHTKADELSYVKKLLELDNIDI